jgi:hypothetical protein
VFAGHNLGCSFDIVGRHLVLNSCCIALLGRSPLPATGNAWSPI